MARVDLFFGADDVGHRAWDAFLKSVITPRFPDGLTTFDARGQWRGRHGIMAERTRVLVIYYRRSATSGAAIDAIRAAFKSRFRQASVLRADSSACVSF